MTITKKDSWLAVDRAGMAQVLARRSKGLAICELVSNAWDEDGVTEVEVRIEPVQGQPLVDLWVTDNAPKGFEDLEEARVLFAPSKKKADATKRGRFNVGEKLVLALCRKAQIQSTTGTIAFMADGTVKRTRGKREVGTEVYVQLRMTREELAEALDELQLLLPPEGIETIIRYGGHTHVVREPDDEFTRFEATLQTEVADDEGNLRPTQRKTTVRLHHGIGDGDGYLYEMGIPVMPIDAPYYINVMQKIPLTIDRANVSPAFLRRLMGYVLNVASRDLTEEEAKAAWVTEAMAQPHVTSQALDETLDRRFGPKRVAYDPSDPEANSLAQAQGYAVVHGGALPRDVWARTRETGTVRPAGQVTPSNRVEFNSTGEDVTVPIEKWKDGGAEIVGRFERIAQALVGQPVSVGVVNDPRGYAACYGHNRLLLNVRRLGWPWFERGRERLLEEHLDLLLHELGHHYAEDHLSSKYHDALTRLGACLALVLVADPGLLAQ